MTDVATHVGTREIAAHYGLSDRTIRRLAREGLIPAVKLGPRGSYRIRLEDVERIAGSGSAAAPADARAVEVDVRVGDPAASVVEDLPAGAAEPGAGQ